MICSLNQYAFCILSRSNTFAVLVFGGQKAYWSTMHLGTHQSISGRQIARTHSNGSISAKRRNIVLPPGLPAIMLPSLSPQSHNDKECALAGVGRRGCRGATRNNGRTI